MFRIKRKIVLFFIVAIIIVICILRFFNFGIVPSVEDGYLVTMTSAEELDDIHTGTVYFGADYCPTCVIFKPILEEFCNTNGIKIYYFDIGYLVDNKLIDDNSLDSILEKYQLEEIPTLININDYQMEEMITFGYIDNDKHDSIFNQLEKFTSISNQVAHGVGVQKLMQFLSVVLLIISILASLSIYILVFKLKYATINNIILVISIAALVSVFILRRQLVYGADMYDWSMNSIYTVILAISFLINTTNIIASIIMIRKKEDI